MNNLYWSKMLNKEGNTMKNDKQKAYYISLKEKHRQQFERAMEFVLDHLKKKYLPKDIVTLLNDAGYKTRTGRKWTLPTLQNEIKKHE